MKYVLILHVCSYLNADIPVCTSSHLVPLQFQTYKECILQGYKSSMYILKINIGDKHLSTKIVKN